MRAIVAGAFLHRRRLALPPWVGGSGARAKKLGASADEVGAHTFCTAFGTVDAKADSTEERANRVSDTRQLEHTLGVGRPSRERATAVATTIGSRFSAFAT